MFSAREQLSDGLALGPAMPGASLGEMVAIG